MAEDVTTIGTFPDHILLLVFRCLDTVSLVRASRVCLSWYNVSRDPSLNSVLDLRLTPLKLRQLWSVCQRKIAASTTAVHIRGATHSDNSMDKLSVCFLEMLQSKVPNMTVLTMENFDLTSIPLTSLPSNLKRLSLYKSMLTMGWFDALKFQNFFGKLKALDLHSCSKISNSDLEALSYLGTLTELSLADCYRISARGIPGLKKNLNRLKRVDFSGCPGVTDVFLYYISSLPLQYLKLRFCHSIHDQGMKNLFMQNIGSTLKTLDIYSCHEVTDETLELISKNASCLLHLDIGACNRLTQERVDSLKEELPKCHIDFYLPSVSQECRGQPQNQAANGHPCRAIHKNSNANHHGFGWS